MVELPRIPVATSLGYTMIENGECCRRHPGDDLAQSRVDADGSGNSTQCEIESAGSARQIGDHKDGHNAEDPRSNTGQNLDGHYQLRIRLEGVENSMNRKYAERFFLKLLVVLPPSTSFFQLATPKVIEILI